MPKSTYTVKEVAKLLGYSTNTVYKYLEEGSIKAVRLGEEGRFRIPAGEVERLLQERGVSLQQTTHESQVESVNSPNIFDWFVGFLSMGLGFSQFINPIYATIQQPLAKFAPYLNIANVLLFIGGALLLGFDVFKIRRNQKHTILNLSLGVLYLILAGIFISQGSVLSVGYLSLALVLIISVLRKINYRLQYLIFVNVLFALVYMGFLVWPNSSTFSSLFRTQIVNKDIFIASWFVFSCLFLFLSYKAFKDEWRFVKITSFIVGAIALIYSVISFTGGFWSRTIFGITLGTFSFIYPFTDEFGSFKTRTRKEATVSFLWLLGIFFVGSIMLRTFYRSFQNVILDDMERRVSLASEITKNVMDRNVATLYTFVDDTELSILLSKGKPTEALDSKLKQIYLSSNNSFARIAVTDSRGRVIDTYPFYLDGQNVNISEGIYFKKPVETGKIFVSELVQPNSLGIDPSIVISLPITDSGGKLLGVILGSVDTSELQKQLGQISSNDVGSFVIADSGGNQILNPDPKGVTVKTFSDSLGTKAASGETRSVVTYDSEGVLRFEAYKNIDTYNWGVMARRNQTSTVETYSMMGFAIFLFFIITTVGSLTLVMFLRKSK